MRVSVGFFLCLVNLESNFSQGAYSNKEINIMQANLVGCKSIF